MTFDFQSEALAFTRKHGCPPAGLIQKAMERGAEIALVKMTKQLRAINAENDLKMRISLGYAPHGENNGSLAG